MKTLCQLKTDCYIPHEAVVAPHFENLIAAGRCISAEREPYASVRVQATCMSMGEAAGLMADLYCKTAASVFALPVDRLRARINERNFVL